MIHVHIPEDKYIKSYKVKLYPTEEQKATIDRYINLSRYVYNWALEIQIEHEEKYMVDLEEKRLLSRQDVERKFTKLRNAEGYEFLKEIPHISARMAIWDLMKGFDMYYRGFNKHPRFKSKKDYKGYSYTTRFDTMYFEGKMLRIEGFKRGEKIRTGFDSGWTKETSPVFYKPVISRYNNGTYWITFGVMVDKPLDFFEKNKIKPLGRAIGIDLNVEKRFQLSNGDVYYAPNLDREIKRLKRYQRKVSKDIRRFKQQERTNPKITVTKSNRSKKRLRKYQNQEKRIANITENFIQQTTKEIIKMHPTAIVMEDLNVLNMHKTRFISKVISPVHSNFYRIREVMTQKCNMYGIPLIIAPRTYPSSQLCSNCGHRQKIGSRKIYRCPICGQVIDRDLNAALNLEALAYIDFEISEVA